MLGFKVPLVLVPRSGLQNWRREPRLWLPGSRRGKCVNPGLSREALGSRKRLLQVGESCSVESQSPGSALGGVGPGAGGEAASSASGCSGRGCPGGQILSLSGWFCVPAGAGLELLFS